ncbi:MAG: caspase family protein [Deltaproteobacteria bacterium]|nr:caspase family protein [Deltaproteobacteria bacterium]MBW2085564.1 caspase family protein [Deltaproteobacteria bacterium]
MRQRIIYTFLIVLISVLMSAAPALSATRGLRVINVVTKEGKKIGLYKDYHALVVGVSDYEYWPKLPYTIDDCKEVSAKLRELGFQVKQVFDPTSRELKTALSEMVYKMGREENRAILFYYAGHGETEKLADKTNMGYIVPRDCPMLKNDPMGFATHAVSMRDIESASLKIRARHVIMLFDSCFSGALFALVRAVPHDITEKSLLPVRQYITAGREDEQVPDKSIFKRCLLVGLDGDADLTGDGYITGSELGMYLSDRVVNYTHRMQHPQYGKINNPNLDRGEFIFVPAKARQKQAKRGAKVQEEETAIAEELKKLREERKKTEELMRQMRQLLEAKLKVDEKEKEVQAEKLDVEERLKLAKEEQQQDKKAKDSRIKELEIKRMEAETKHQREVEEKKALEEELKRVKAEMERLKQQKDLNAKKADEQRLASIPKTKMDVFQRVRLGQSPFVIDDFEDEDLWAVNFHDNWLKKAVGSSEILLTADTTQGANSTSCSMKMKYDLGENAMVLALIGGRTISRIKQIKKNKITAYDFSKYNKFVFYLKGEKKKGFFSRPHRIHIVFSCYNEDLAKSNKWVSYYNEAKIVPTLEWQKIEIYFDDLVPSAGTKKNIKNYPEKPDLRNILNILFLFTSHSFDGGMPGSNTVWIDEIRLE